MTSTTVATAPARPNRLYLAAWRWHFYAGLYVVPFLLTLALSGLVMLWVSALDGREGEKAYRVAAADNPIAISKQAEAALATQPGAALRQYLAPLDAERAALFRLDRDGDATMVAVDPYTGTVLGSWPRRAGWYDFASDVHGTLLLGDLGDRLIEIAAGLALVLIVTGLYLWLPRDRRGIASALLPAWSLRGRALWKSLHQSIGLYVSALLVVFLLSGLAWSGIWGERFVQAWNTFPAEKWDAVPQSDTTHAAMNHGATKSVPWALEQTPLPASGSGAGSAGVPANSPVDLDAVAELARTIGLPGRFQINLPKGDAGVWTISQDSMSNDTDDPTADRTVHVDRFTGRILADIRYADYSPVAKAMAVGIAFHEGDLGVWNVALNTAFCLSVVFLAASGMVMWWKRRPARSGLRLCAPPQPTELPFWKGALTIALLVCLMFPLVGLTVLGLLVLDVLVLQRAPVLRRVLS